MQPRITKKILMLKTQTISKLTKTKTLSTEKSVSEVLQVGVTGSHRIVSPGGVLLQCGY